jgi:hypothetical protein
MPGRNHSAALRGVFALLRRPALLPLVATALEPAVRRGAR